MMKFIGQCLALTNNKKCIRKKESNLYPFCKIHKGYRFEINEYKNEYKNLKSINICLHILQTGKRKGKCCSKLLEKNEKFCSVHKRIVYGLCYKKDCNRTAMKKNYTCKLHECLHPCTCSKHQFDSKVLKSFHILLPMDIIIYNIIPYINNNVNCISKKFRNTINIPMQINLPEGILIKRIAYLLRSVKYEYYICEKVKLVKKLYDLLCENIRFLKSHKEFAKISLYKLNEFSTDLKNWNYYYKIIKTIISE